MEKRTSDTLEHLFSLEGKRGMITGGSSGIGLGIARTLADAGALVYDLCRTVRPENQHPGVNQLQTDITDYTQLSQRVEQIGQSGPIDFLINNAGITRRMQAEQVDHKLWQDIHRTNVDALFYLCQLCYPYLKKAKSGGRIVNIASMASYMGFSQVVPYCSSKSAVRGITRGLATEWVRDGILVNSVSPGWFPSQMSQQVMDEQRKQKILAKIPMEEFGKVEDIGSMVLFLVGNGAGYITGQDFVVDGGAQTYGF